MIQEILKWSDSDSECRELRCKLLNSMIEDLLRHTFVRSEWFRKWRTFVNFVLMKFAIRSGRTVRVSKDEIAPVVQELTINAKEYGLGRIKEIEMSKRETSNELVKRGDLFDLLPLGKGWVFLAACQLEKCGWTEGKKHVTVSDERTQGAVELSIHKGTEGDDDWYGVVAGEPIGVMPDCFLDLCATADLLVDGQVVYLTWED